jgi:Helicase associated domain
VFETEVETERRRRYGHHHRQQQQPPRKSRKRAPAATLALAAAHAEEQNNNNDVTTRTASPRRAKKRQKKTTAPVPQQQQQQPRSLPLHCAAAFHDYSQHPSGDDDEEAAVAYDDDDDDDGLVSAPTYRVPRKGKKSWDEFFGELQDFKRVHGHVHVTIYHKEHASMFFWLTNQRDQWKKRLKQLQGQPIVKGDPRCTVSDEQIQRMIDIGLGDEEGPTDFRKVVATSFPPLFFLSHFFSRVPADIFSTVCFDRRLMMLIGMPRFNHLSNSSKRTVRPRFLLSFVSLVFVLFTF